MRGIHSGLGRVVVVYMGEGGQWTDDDRLGGNV